LKDLDFPEIPDTKITIRMDAHGSVDQRQNSDFNRKNISQCFR